MHYLFGFLMVTFVVHAVAFTLLGIKRRKRYYFFLTGTFVFLTSVYILKFQGISPQVMGTGMSLQAILRILAIACTLSYLLTISRTPGTWLSRLLGRG